MTIADSLLLLSFLLLIGTPAVFVYLRIRQSKENFEPGRLSRVFFVDFPTIEVSLNDEKLWQSLTQREQAVAKLVGRGLSNAEIAQSLQIRTRTVDAHLQNIYPKLKVRSRTQIAHRYYAFLGIESDRSEER